MENDKYFGRVPIVPDNVNNSSRHLNGEIVLDFENSDLYIKKDGRYINITGTIQNSIRQIQDGSSVIHIVTEDSLPSIKDRKTNHWYFVVTSAKTLNDTDLDTSSYIYYGVVNSEYYEDKSYMLITQNMVHAQDNAVMMEVQQGFKACFYVPVELTPTFRNMSNGAIVEFEIQDRVYCLTPSNTTIAYDVYMSKSSNLGRIKIGISFTKSASIKITIKSNETNIQGLSFPERTKFISSGSPIGFIKYPTWTDGSYNFIGWSLSKISYEPVDLSTYTTVHMTTIYAYFEKDETATHYKYTANYISPDGDIIYTSVGSAAPGTIIMPIQKIAEGYSTYNNGVTLVSPDMILSFTCYKDVYNITYIGTDGATYIQPEYHPVTYSIQNTSITPSNMIKSGYTFSGWIPNKIDPYTTGDITFNAIWEKNGVLKNITELKPLLTALINGKDVTNISYIDYNSYQELPDSTILVSTTTSETNIYAFYDESNKHLNFISTADIEFSNIKGLFKDYDKLVNIEGLSRFIPTREKDISELFSGCTSLTDISPIIDKWNIQGLITTDTFKDTHCQIPSWAQS